MKLLAVASLAALALVTGCTASSDSTGAATDEVTGATWSIPLAQSEDVHSLQGKLYMLLQNVAGDPDVDVTLGGGGSTESNVSTASASLTGPSENGAPASVECTMATDGSTLLVKTSFSCTFEGFEPTRLGGQLPQVTVNAGTESPLANKLFTVLKKGYEKGNLGVVKTGGNENPPCCDIPSTEKLAIKDDLGTLTCGNSTGGFAMLVQSYCTFTRNLAPNE